MQTDICLKRCLRVISCQWMLNLSVQDVCPLIQEVRLLSTLYSPLSETPALRPYKAFTTNWRASLLTVRNFAGSLNTIMGKMKHSSKFVALAKTYQSKSMYMRNLISLNIGPLVHRDTSFTQLYLTPVFT